MRERKAFNLHATQLKLFVLFYEKKRINGRGFKKKLADPIFHFASKLFVHWKVNILTAHMGKCMC